MINSDIASVVELTSWLAEQPCSHIKLSNLPYHTEGLGGTVVDIIKTPCLKCQGTDRAFPWASEVCWWCRGKQRILKHLLILDDGTGEPYVPVDDDYDPCTHCSSGRVPKDVGLGELLDLYPMILFPLYDDSNNIVSWSATYRAEALIQADGETPTLAVLRTVAKAQGL